MKFHAPVLLATLASLPAAQARKISGDLATLEGGRAYDLVLDPGGEGALFTGEFSEVGRFDLWCGSVQGTFRPRRLAVGPVTRFAPVPGGGRVLCSVDPEGSVPPELLVIPVDGTEPRSLSNGPLRPLGFSAVTSSRVLCFMDEPGEPRLWSMPLDGSAPPTALAFVSSTGEDFGNFAIALSPDGTNAVFAIEMSSPARVQVSTVPVDGSAAVRRLVTFAGLRAENLRFSDDGQRVLMLQRRTDAAATGVYSYASSGAVDARFLGHALDFRTASGARVLFRDESSLAIAPQDGSAPKLTLATDLDPGEYLTRSIRDLYSVGGSRAAYADVTGQLRSVALDGSGFPLTLTGNFVAGGRVNWIGESTPDDRVLYSADGTIDEVHELFTIQADGSAPPVRLHAPLFADSDAFQGTLFADASRVLFQVRVGPTVELFSSAIDGSDLSRSHMGPVTAWNVPIALVQGDRIVFRATRFEEEDLACYTVGVGGGEPQRISPAPAFGTVMGDVGDFLHAPDGRSVVYRARGDGDSEDLYHAPLDGKRPVLHLPRVAGGVSREFDLSADGTLVAFLSAGNRQLFAAPLDARSAATLLAPGSIESFLLAPGEALAAFVDDAAAAGRFELFRVPLDGSAPPERLNPVLVNGGDVLDGPEDYRFSPDGTRLVFRADAESDETFELHSAPAAGAAASVRLNGTLAAGGDVTSFGITPESSRVVYLADQLSDGVAELFVVPIGGGTPLRLSAPLVAGGAVTHFVIAPDGSRVLYRADGEVNERFELYSVPLDGSAAPVKLSGTLIAAGDVRSGFLCTPDSAHVVYRADAASDERIELYAATLGGGAAPVRLNAILAAGSVLPDFRVTSGGRIVYRAQQFEAGKTELVSASPAGDDHRRLNGPLGSDSNHVDQFALAEGRNEVYFLADPELNGRIELFRADDRFGLPFRVDTPGVPGGSVRGFAVAPDGSSVAWTADSQTLDVVELFLAPSVEPKASGAPTPTRSVEFP